MKNKIDNSNKSLKVNVEENFGLVHLCCQRFRKGGADYEEIFQCGCIGLIKAAKNFDLSRQIKFSTYAVPVILGEIRAFFRDNTPLKASRALKELSVKIKYTQEEFLRVNLRLPTVNELCSLLEVETDQILEALEMNKPLVSLDNSSQGKEIPIPFEDDKVWVKMSLMDALKLLPISDRTLIYLRFFKYMTQTKTAQKLGMTQVQVSRREKAILKFLRAKLI